jgi:hypothetical protein
MPTKITIRAVSLRLSRQRRFSNRNAPGAAPSLHFVSERQTSRQKEAMVSSDCPSSSDEWRRLPHISFRRGASSAISEHLTSAPNAAEPEPTEGRVWQNRQHQQTLRRCSPPDTINDKISAPCVDPRSPPVPGRDSVLFHLEIEFRSRMEEASCRDFFSPRRTAANRQQPDARR